MSHKYIFILFLFAGPYVLAQLKPEEKDSVPVYKKIETYSQKSKFTKTIYDLIFRSSHKKSKKSISIKKQMDYSAFQGKPIRNISIETLDPFGFSVEDTTKQAKSWLGNVGNKVHIKSNNFAIRNLLLFKKHALLDTLQITESKRLMRSQKFIRSVKIDVKKIQGEHDSVDIKVRVLDSWSWVPQGSISTSKFNFHLKERNFLGFGHEFNNRLSKRFNDGRTAYSFDYIVPTIKNTYINTSLTYQQTLEGYYKKSINIEKNFLSTLNKWAGGIYIDRQFRQDSLPNDSFEFKNNNFKYSTQDMWIGRAFDIFKNNKYGSRTTNLITSLRFINSNYTEKPELAYDAIDYYADEVFYMGRIGVALREFEEDAYIFRDGIVEDVPIGFASSITLGIQKKNQNSRLYLGSNLAIAKYTKRGYFNGTIELGTFFNNRKLEQTALSLELNYFTNLIPLSGSWTMRQFIKPQILLGFNRLDAIGDRLNLNENAVSIGYDRNEYRRHELASIPGFNTDINGSQKILLSLQTQFYSPWNLIGFRLNPYINITSGLMGRTTDLEFNKKLYASVGVGFIIRNDYLVFNSFQVSLSYYPRIPGQGYNIFKTNSFETQNFGFGSIEIGKPTTVWYQ
ncbi:hypothetical protein EV196_102415 [Mariniflexile fucanivorans]|uniref:Outer membrane protein assembly factor BamA n=1 Tax=Mariniflexile fucanivorans TaxID=264023 RepID=A0A4R1RPN7_9FLAO|nr:hypothetical protein [Mariniflexile fucanivorans]TCL67852.1 hypothetical protein EV196_102415 [Mariniflexile fucanivorans]